MLEGDRLRSRSRRHGGHRRAPRRSLRLRVRLAPTEPGRCSAPAASSRSTPSSTRRATEGAAASLSADESSLHLAVRSDLDPDRARGTRRVLRGPAVVRRRPDSRHRPGLARLPRARRSRDRGRRAARSGADEFAGSRRRLPRRPPGSSGKQAGIDIGEDLLPLLGSEAALSLQPVAAAADVRRLPGVTPDAATPYVSLIAKDVDPEAASKSLGAPAGARRQGAGTARERPGRRASRRSRSPACRRSRSRSARRSTSPTPTWDDRLVIATDSLGIEQARSIDERTRRVGQVPGGHRGLPDSVSLIAYLDLTGLLNLGEQAGSPSTRPTRPTPPICGR